MHADKAPPPRTRSGAMLRVPGRALLGLVPLILLVSATELILWAAGVGGGEDAAHGSLSRGFDPGAAYLLPDPQVPGGWRTQIFDTLEDELIIPPKGEALRILLFGGSNTQLFPEEVLEEELAELDPGRGWEVLNLGRAGYGSERVLIFLEQAMQLEPDVVVIYSGHNEFVEAGFADELGFGTGGSNVSWGRRLSGALRRLRGFNLLEEAFASSGSGSSAWAEGGASPSVELVAPEPWELGERTSFSLEETETQRYYAAFERNLEAMCAAASRAGARVVLCTPVGNLLVPPVEIPLGRWIAHQDLSDAQRRTLTELIEATDAALPERFRPLIRPTANLRVFHWYSARMDGVHDDSFEAPAPRPLGPPLAEAPARAGDRKRASASGAHWPEPAQWGQLVRDRTSAVASLMERELTPDERAALVACAEGYREARELSGGMPRLSHSLGIVLWLLGDDDARALALLQEARDRDVAPRAANGPIHDAIRRVAARRDGLVLLDSARLYAEASPDGLVGPELMMDVCHLQPGARVVLMQRLAEAIAPLADD